MSTEADIRAWVRDENKKVMAEMLDNEDKRELAFAKREHELQLMLQKANNQTRADPLTAENKTLLGVIALVVIGFGLALGAYIIDPSDAQECVKLCDPKGVAKWSPATPGAHETCECRP